MNARIYLLSQNLKWYIARDYKNLTPEEITTLETEYNNPSMRVEFYQQT